MSYKRYILYNYIRYVILPENTRTSYTTRYTRLSRKYIRVHIYNNINRLDYLAIDTYLRMSKEDFEKLNTYMKMSSVKYLTQENKALKDLVCAQEKALTISEKYTETLNLDYHRLIRHTQDLVEKIKQLKEKRNVLKSEKLQLQYDFVDIGRKNKVANNLMQKTIKEKNKILEMLSDEDREKLNQMKMQLKGESNASNTPKLKRTHSGDVLNGPKAKKLQK